MVWLLMGFLPFLPTPISWLQQHPLPLFPEHSKLLLHQMECCPPISTNWLRHFTEPLMKPS